jgi:hypothetical protein
MVAAAVHDLRRLIAVDWRRAYTDVREGCGFGREWFAGREPRLKPAQFIRRWAAQGVLCAVVADGQGKPRLDLRLTLQHPVHFLGQAGNGGAQALGPGGDDVFADLSPLE